MKPRKNWPHRTCPYYTGNICLDTPAMTPEEFKERMNEIKPDPSNNFYNYDVETSHSKMDDLMCELLRSLGYGEGIDIFEAAEKWYA